MKLNLRALSKTMKIVFNFIFIVHFSRTKPWSRKDQKHLVSHIQPHREAMNRLCDVGKVAKHGQPQPEANHWGCNYHANIEEN